MASWTDQDTDSLLPGEPWTSAKALAAFENPVALAEGAAGAPKIQTAAYDANTVNEDAMKVQQFSDSGTVSASGTATVTIPGNLVFFPRVSGTNIEGVMAGGQLKIKNTDPDNSQSYTVSWYRIIP
jgi:hypothetical protein